MEYEIDFEILDPVSNNPSLDNIVPINPKPIRARTGSSLTDRRRDVALRIPEEALD